MASVLVPLAPGCEELEAVTIIDLLRRAHIQVSSAGLAPGPVTCSRGTIIIPDTTLTQALQQEFDMIVLPGGQPGATNLKNDARIIQLLQSMARSGKYIAAICAAPTVLAHAGLLAGKRATAYPGALEGVGHGAINISQETIVIDDKIITSRGPGTAMDFALELIRVLVGKEKRDGVETALARPTGHAVALLSKD